MFRFLVWLALACLVLVVADHTGTFTDLSDLSNTLSWVCAVCVAACALGACTADSKTDTDLRNVAALGLFSVMFLGGDQQQVAVFATAAAVLAMGAMMVGAHLPRVLTGLVPKVLHPQH